MPLFHCRTVWPRGAQCDRTMRCPAKRNAHAAFRRPCKQSLRHLPFALVKVPIERAGTYRPQPTKVIGGAFVRPAAVSIVEIWNKQETIVTGQGQQRAPTCVVQPCRSVDRGRIIRAIRAHPHYRPAKQYRHSVRTTDVIAQLIACGACDLAQIATAEPSGGAWALAQQLLQISASVRSEECTEQGFDHRQAEKGPSICSRGRRKVGHVRAIVSDSSGERWAGYEGECVSSGIRMG